MGRKTFISIGKPLPNRTNIVLSREESLSNAAPITFDEQHQVYNVSSKEAALYLADLYSIVSGQNSFFIIGGEEIFNLFSANKLVDRVYLTEIFAEITGDAFFKLRFPKKEWKAIEAEHLTAKEGDDYDSQFVVYERRERRYRDRYLSSFYKESFAKIEWINAYLSTHQNLIRDYESSHQYELDLSNQHFQDGC